MSTFVSVRSNKSDTSVDTKFAFLAKWVGATSVGFFLGTIALVFAAGVAFRDDVFRLLGNPGLDPALRVLALAGVGASVGALQYSVLRPHIDRSFPWVIATAAGWSLASLIGTEIAILATSTLQWLVIKRRRPSQSFVTWAANLAAVGFGVIAALVFLNLGSAIVTALPLASNDSKQVGYLVVSAAVLGLAVILAGGFYGMFTASAQMLLLRGAAHREDNKGEVR